MEKAKKSISFHKLIKDIFYHDAFVEEHRPSSLSGMISLQLIVAFSFLLLSITNVLAKSYLMLAFTGAGFVINILFAFVAMIKKNRKISSGSCIITCSLLFTTFVVSGGNDGFACLWVILLPLLSMVILDFKYGLVSSIFFQIYLMVVFWTPLKDKLLYTYNEQFCLRFPLFFFVTFTLGFLLSASLRNTQYNECRHLIELEEVNKQANLLSRTDYLTKLANRRYSYEELESRFSNNNVKHCIVMGDIDDFKHVNDLHGHEFGDEVLVTISNYIKEVLPADYLKSRWGGEEFLFAANDSIDVVYQKVEELRKTIASHKFKFDDASSNITMTFGVAEYDDINGITDAINLADKRLYEGKNHDKNCTIIK